ncbi:MAG: PEP-CTERM sorting domain-containing protein [Armatimonadota bacterium]
MNVKIKLIYLALLACLTFFGYVGPAHAAYQVIYQAAGGEATKTDLRGGYDPLGIDGWDGERLWPLTRQDSVYALFWRQSGVNGWNGPTGYFVNDFRGPVAPGQTKIVDNLYLWAEPEVPQQPLVLQPLLLYFGPDILSYKLRLVSVPAGITYNGPYVWYGIHGDIMLPYYSSADGSTGYRFQAEISTVPEPSVLVTLFAGLMGVASVWRRQRAVFWPVWPCIKLARLKGCGYTGRGFSCKRE